MSQINWNIYLKNYKEYIESMGLEFRLPLNEMLYTPLTTKYFTEPIKSKYFENRFDYNVWFDTEKSKIETGHTYVFQFQYYKDTIGPFRNLPLCNICFTTKEQYEETKDMNSVEAYKIYELPTGNNEREELIQRLLYLFTEFHNNYGKENKYIYVIGETENIIKTNYYKKLIEDSIPNVGIINGESSINLGKNVYYFIPPDKL